MFEEVPKLCQKGGPLFFGEFAEFDGFVLSRMFRHRYSPIRSELVEIAVNIFGRSSANPVTVCIGIKLAAKRITACQTED